MIDLIVACGDGSVLWFENTETKIEPKFEEDSESVSKSQLGSDITKFEPGMWGVRVKVYAVDWNNDGRMDLLLGDRSGRMVTVQDDSAADSDTSDRAGQARTTRHGFEWVFLRKS